MGVVWKIRHKPTKRVFDALLTRMDNQISREFVALQFAELIVAARSNFPVSPQVMVKERGLYKMVPQATTGEEAAS